MTREYTPFSISNFRTGFDEAVEPWLLPRDAYQTVINAHLYRGVLEKINGYTLFAKFSYRNILTLGVPNGVTKTFTGNLPTLPTTSNFFAYGTITVTGNAGGTPSTAETFSYASSTGSVVTLVGSAGGTGTVNISTGAYSITFNTAPPLNTYSAIFIVWDSAPLVTTAIMGIKQYYGSNGSQQVMVFDQKRVGIIVSNMGILAAQSDALQAVSEIPHDYYQSAIFTGAPATVTFTGTLSGAPFIPGTLVWTEFLSTGARPPPGVADKVGRYIIDNGVGDLILGPNSGGAGLVSGSVNYVTGAYTITFSVAPTTGNYFDSTTGLFGNLFTGSISNFFSLCTYQYNAFFTNNVDPVFYYDGASIHYLPTNLSTKTITAVAGVPRYTGANSYDISTCLHVFINQSRLLLISPTVEGVIQASTIYWSRALVPTDFTNDEQLPASTAEYIKAIGAINTDLVVRFSNSERIFRYTGDDTSPFRWDSTNNIFACDAPYSAINYDSWFSTVGRPAIVGSDAVNVKRVDEIIPDFTDPTRLAQQTPVPFMSQTSIKQCYGERFDDLKEGWLCYNALPVAQSTVQPSDNVLAFNYLDGTYAIYQFPFSCLGYGRIVNVPTWDSIFTEWTDMALTWDSYQFQSNALIDLGGDQFDKVYEIDSGNTLGDGLTPVLMDVISKNFNPFIEQGQLCRLGYVDLFVSANQQSKLRVQFYVNDNLYVDDSSGSLVPSGFYQETTLVFTPTDAMSPTNAQVKVWKRIYVGAVAKEHTIRFYQNAADFTSSTLDQPVFIHAMVLYMKPAGRIFN